MQGSAIGKLVARLKAPVGIDVCFNERVFAEFSRTGERSSHPASWSARTGLSRRHAKTA